MRFIQGSLDNFLPLVEAFVLAPESNGIGEACRALIDTGATRTTVSEHMVETHQLPLRGKMLTQSARSHPERRRAYGFRLGLFCQDRSATDPPTLFVLDHMFAAPPFQTNDCFDVLIGNDMLSTGRFVLDRGHFSFEF